MSAVIRKLTSLSTANLPYDFLLLSLFEKGTMTPCFPLSKPSNIFSGKLGLHCLPGRHRTICKPSFQKLRSHAMKHHGCFPGSSSAVSTHRIVASCLLVRATVPLATFLLILCSFIHAGVSNTNSCCVRTIFLRRYDSLSAPFASAISENDCACPQYKACFSLIY